jgi:mono/diheme cytochrome c family protein
VPLTKELIDGARRHFADHCASCHANDGSGKTTPGQGLYPRAPDMRTANTQSLSDGELFFIIEHGVRFTGCRVGQRVARERGGRMATGAFHPPSAEVDAR